MTENHYSLLQEPGSQYIGRVTPKAGDASSICDTITDYLTSSTNDKVLELAIAGSNGTVLNTGMAKGLLRCLEVKLRHPLQWSICLLHFNQLPLKHLLHDIDGRAVGPQGLPGPIGNNLKNCEDLGIGSFVQLKYLMI